MNIFVILIMAVMLATYQYFTAKRTSDTALNKDELRLQAELSCMKQYHEFASSKNEFITNAGDKPVMLSGDTNQIGCAGNEDGSKNDITCNNGTKANYTCTGANDITVSKYCTNNTGLAFIDCQTACDSKGYHCVATTKWKKFSNDDKYLASQILKSNVNIATEADEKYTLKDKITYFGTKPKLTKAETDAGTTLKAIGMVSCVEACKVSSQTLLKGQTCEDGYIITQKEDGTLTCSKLSEASPCTAHEDEVKDKGTRTNCTAKQTNGNYCCAKQWYNYDENPTACSSHSSQCCATGTVASWDATQRIYSCISQESVCNNQSVTMSIVNEKGESLTINGKNTITVNNALNSKYNKSSKKFICNIKPDDFINECKALAKNSTEYAYLKTSFAYKNIDGSETTLGDMPVDGTTSYKADTSRIITKCHIASKKNSSSVENCTPCQATYFDKTLNKWTCRNYSWTGSTYGAEYNIKSNGTLINTLSQKNEKGVKSCLSTCSDAQIEKLKQGTRNGKYWGLTWDEKSKMWSCFNCNPEATYNYVWHCSGGAPKNAKSVDIMNTSLSHISTNEQGKDVTVSCQPQNQDNSNEGKCMPFNCASEYQVQINGQCYTKWCSKKLEGFPQYAEINAPKISHCPSSAPWMTYNTVKTCVYCIRPPDVKTN